MSTRCLIGKENKNKTITYIYCHHDGYPDWVGKVLLQNYRDEEKINKLLALGDMSSLGKQPVPAKSFEDYSNDTCTPYSLREEDCPAITVKNEREFLEQDRWQEYFYLFRNGKWYFATEGGFEELRESFCGISDNN